MKIAGNSAIVTGGASGLGAATARLLAEHGAKVAILDVQREAGEALAAELGALFLQTDVTNEAKVDAALDASEAAHGPARILVNCAGIAPAIRTVGRDFAPHSVDRFRRIIEINLIGTFIVLSRFAARLAQLDPVGGERGVIVNTASIAAYDGQIGHAAYSASKNGIVGFTLPIARELGPLLIRIMAIAPGLFRTPIFDALPAHVQEGIVKHVPHPRRLADPREFAQLVEFIINNPMLNGETVRIDGALRLP